MAGTRAALGGSQGPIGHYGKWRATWWNGGNGNCRSPGYDGLLDVTGNQRS